jgi:hypothetical protein
MHGIADRMQYFDTHSEKYILRHVQSINKNYETHSLKSFTTNQFCVRRNMGRDSSAGIATRHGLDGLGIESRGGQVFPHPS